MLHFSETAPFPCTPTPREQGKARPQNKKEQPVGLHFDFARRLPQSYILKLLDRSRRRPRKDAKFVFSCLPQIPASFALASPNLSTTRPSGSCDRRDATCRSIARSA